MDYFAAAMQHQDYENILGFPVTRLSQKKCISQIFSWIEAGEKGKYFVCANPHCLVMAMSDCLYKSAMLSADMITPDGTGIVLASRILKGSIKERVTGSDIFSGLNRLLDKAGGYRYFFLGSSEDRLSLIRENIKHKFPKIEVVGTYSPPFKTEFSPEENKAMVDAVNRVRPDVLWVGMTAPKQEKWIYEHRDILNVKFIGAVGAVFDFYVGTVKRSHPWFQKHGLEWLPRLLQEPGRLCDRMLISAPMFLYRVAKQRFSQNSAPSGTRLPGRP